MSQNVELKPLTREDEIRARSSFGLLAYARDDVPYLLRKIDRLREALRATGLHNLPGGVYADDWTEDVGVYVSPAALRKVVAALEEPKL